MLKGLSPQLQNEIGPIQHTQFHSAELGRYWGQSGHRANLLAALVRRDWPISAIRRSALPWCTTRDLRL